MVFLQIQPAKAGMRQQALRLSPRGAQANPPTLFLSIFSFQYRFFAER